MAESEPVLYRPDWHEQLTDRAWDEAWVRTAIAALVRDAVAAWDDDQLWPVHESDAFEPKVPTTDVYSGAAGVIWALVRLGADFDAAAAAARAHERLRPLPAEIDGMKLPAPTTRTS